MLKWNLFCVCSYALWGSRENRGTRSRKHGRIPAESSDRVGGPGMESSSEDDEPDYIIDSRNIGVETQTETVPVCASQSFGRGPSVRRAWPVRGPRVVYSTCSTLRSIDFSDFWLISINLPPVNISNHLPSRSPVQWTSRMKAIGISLLNEFFFYILMDFVDW